MLFSMTGYSTGIVDLKLKGGKSIPIVIEIKSLNSRFFELTTRLSKNLGFLETDIHTLLRKKLIRGRVYCAMHPSTTEGEFGTVVPAMETVQGYIKAIKKIKTAHKLKGDFDVADLIFLPNVFENERTEISESSKKELLKHVEKLANKVNDRRKVEGDHIRKDIGERSVLCHNSLNKIAQTYEQLMKDNKKLIAKTKKQVDSGKVEQQGKLDDLYVALNKIDIHEEITRFKSHLSNVNNLLKNKDREKGKRLDFTLQELVRETNTIAAKCSNATISALAVDIKVELEKIREQAQNVL